MGDDLGPVPAAPDAGRAHDERRRSEPEVLASIAAEAGLRRIHFVAWRDLDDPEAGGSELHAHKVASRWAAAGLDVTFRTSAVPGAPAALTRDGYRVLRRSGTLRRLPGRGVGGHPHGAPARRRAGRDLERHAVPLARSGTGGRASSSSHHVHAEMWGMVLPPTLARMGDTGRAPHGAPLLPLEPHRDAVRVVARTRSSTCCGLRPDRVTVAPPGVDARFTPGGQRSPAPLVVAVGRLVPVKRFDALLRALAEVKADHPGAAGGHHRRGLRASRRSRRCASELGATEWVELPGPRRRRGAGVVVPPGLGRGEQLAARGLGHDAHRGGRLRHPGRGHRHRRPRRRRARRRVGPAGRRAGRPGRRARAACWATRCCAAACRRAPWPGRAGSPGTPRPGAPSRRWPRRRRGALT